MISKTVIIIISVVIFVGILALIIYFKNKKKKGSTNPLPNPNIDPNKCKGEVCGNNCCQNGEHCQSDQQTCCKNELWSKNEKGFNVCCGSALCGGICCDKDHKCGVDKNNNPVCCSENLCGPNNLCCSATGEECQEDGTCCKPELWDKVNKRCCTKPLCNGLCCNNDEQCDPNTKKCITCTKPLCDGKCCDPNSLCYQGTTKKNCCTKELCGDNCCENSTCMSDFSCCKTPCEGVKGDDGKIVYNSCCSNPNKPYCNNNVCCADDKKCVVNNDSKDPICYNQTICGQDKDGNCVCCVEKDSKGNYMQKYVNGKCENYCGQDIDKNNIYCDPDTQYCVSETVNGQTNYLGCGNNGCTWNKLTYDPSIESKSGIIAEFSEVDVPNVVNACYYIDENNVKRDYIVNNPKDPYDPNKNITPDKLTGIGYTNQSTNSLKDCNANNCKKISHQADMDYANYDVDTKKCLLNFNCSKLPPLESLQKNKCPTVEESCCKDANNNYTGQVCPKNRPCYQNQCICHLDENPKNNDCVYFDSHHTCNDNGNPDPNSKDFSCICINKNYAGNHCQYSRIKTCNDHGNPKNDGTCTGQCDAGFFGPYCEFNNAITCNGGGVVIDDKGTCKCSNNFFGPNCEYNRSKTCSSRGIPDDNGTCFCDPSFKGANCASVINNGSIKWVYIAKNPEADQPVKQHVGVLTAPGYSGSNLGFIKFSPGSFLYSISNQIFFMMDENGNMVMQHWGNDEEPTDNDGLRELSPFYVNRNTGIYTDPYGNIMKAI